MELFEALRNEGVSESTITKLWQMFSGCPIYVPKYSDTDLEDRNTEIKRLRKSGVKPHDIARKFGLSYQRIMKIARC